MPTTRSTDPLVPGTGFDELAQEAEEANDLADLLMGKSFSQLAQSSNLSRLAQQAYDQREEINAASLLLNWRAHIVHQVNPKTVTLDESMKRTILEALANMNPQEAIESVNQKLTAIHPQLQINPKGDRAKLKQQAQRTLQGLTNLNELALQTRAEEIFPYIQRIHSQVDPQLYRQHLDAIKMIDDELSKTLLRPEQITEAAILPPIERLISPATLDRAAQILKSLGEIEVSRFTSPENIGELRDVLDKFAQALRVAIETPQGSPTIEQVKTILRKPALAP